MPVYATDDNSKKSQARRRALSFTGLLPDDMIKGIESIHAQNFGVSPDQVMAGVNPALVEQAQETPQSATDFLKNQPQSFQNIFQRLQAPEQPQFDQEGSDSAKKYAKGRALGELAKIIGDVVIASRGGLISQGESPDIPSVLNDINFYNEDFANQMKQYREDLQINDLYNNQLTNKEIELGLAQRQKQAEQEAENASKEKANQFTAEEAQKERDLKERLAKMERDLKARGLNIDAEKNFNYSSQNKLQTVGAYDDAINREIQVYKQMQEDFSVTDTEKAQQLQKIQQLSSDRDNMMKQLSEREGFTQQQQTQPGQMTQQERQMLSPGNAMLNMAISQNQQNPGKQQPKSQPQESKGTTIKKSEVPKHMEDLDKVVNDFVSSGEPVSRSKFDMLVKNYMEIAEAAGLNPDQQKIIDNLKRQGVKINYSQR